MVGSKTGLRGCSAFWCKRRASSDDQHAVPRLFAGDRTKKKTALKKKQKRNKALTWLLRKDAIDAEAADTFAPGRTRGTKTIMGDHRFCKLHVDDRGNPWPLQEDPVLRGDVDGINSGAVAAAAPNTALGQARDTIAAANADGSPGRSDRLAVRQMGGVAAGPQ